MAIRRIHIKSLMYALAQLQFESEYIDMGYHPDKGLILVPSNFKPEENPKEELKTEIKINPKTNFDDLLG